MPHPPGPTGKSERTLPQRFWSKVKKTEGCWNWTGTVNSKGYGRFRVSKWQRPVPAHRLSWEMANGAPGEKQVLHHCDNPRCVRPDHLFLGTASDNMRDMMQKRRGRGQLVTADPRRGPGFNASVSGETQTADPQDSIGAGS